ncbi:MAG: CBS domain-containing protein [Acetobacteraceae bacterium]|nr:CBS domain-containing protein [Acetobacteraceae bacterium]
MSIAAILKNKGHDLISVRPSDSVAEAIAVLAEKRIGAVLALGPGRELAGIISERDIVRALAKHGASALDLKVEELMTREVTTASPETSVPEAMELMTTGRFRHIPVLEGGRLVGLISIGDVVKTRIEQQEHEVDSLRSYVVGGTPDSHVLV